MKVSNVYQLKIFNGAGYIFVCLSLKIFFFYKFYALIKIDYDRKPQSSHAQTLVIMEAKHQY